MTRSIELLLVVLLVAGCNSPNEDQLREVFNYGVICGKSAQQFKSDPVEYCMELYDKQ